MFSYGEEEDEGPQSGHIATDMEGQDANRESGVFKLSEMKDSNSAIVKSKRVQKIIRFLEKSLSKQGPAWIPTGNFSTFLVEMNQKMLSRMNRGLSLPSPDCRIRVIQPAINFYDDLLDLFVLQRLLGPVRPLNNVQVLKRDYILLSKGYFGDRWDPKYDKALEYFYQVLDANWAGDLFKNAQDPKYEIVRFVGNIREVMFKAWEEQIVQKIISLQKKK